MQLAQMRTSFLQATQGHALENEDVKHTVPIATMGNYHEAMQRQTVRACVVVNCSRACK